MQIEFVSQGRSTERQDSGIFIGVLGYEQRSSYVARVLVGDNVCRYAVRYDDVSGFSFGENCEVIVGLGTSIIKHEDIGIVIAAAVASRSCGGEEPLLVGLDISSMSRLTLAQTLLVLSDLACHQKIRLRCYYAVAVYSDPPVSFPPIRESAPVHERFCGLPVRVERPTKLLMGLGHEGGRSIAAIEEFEVSSGWLFFPRGGDRRYEKSVYLANKRLLRSAHKFRLLDYDIHDPSTLCSILDKVIRSASVRHRPIIVPFGPKIFALCTMLMMLAAPGAATVWRMSGGLADAVSDRLASGDVAELTVVLSHERSDVSGTSLRELAH